MLSKLWKFLFVFVIIGSIFVFLPVSSVTAQSKTLEQMQTESHYYCANLYGYSDLYTGEELVKRVVADYYVCYFNTLEKAIAESKSKSVPVPVQALYEYYNVKLYNDSWALINIIKKTYNKSIDASDKEQTGFYFKLGVAKRVDASHWDFEFIDSAIFMENCNSSGNCFTANMPAEMLWLKQTGDLHPTVDLAFPNSFLAVGDSSDLSRGPTANHVPSLSIDMAIYPKRNDAYKGRDTYNITKGNVVLRKGECIGVKSENSSLVIMYLHLDPDYLEREFQVGNVVYPYQFLGKTTNKSDDCGTGSDGHHNHLHFASIFGEDSTFTYGKLSTIPNLIDPRGRLSLNGWTLKASIDGNGKFREDSWFEKSGIKVLPINASYPRVVHSTGNCPDSKPTEYVGLYTGKDCTGEELQLQKWQEVYNIEGSLPNPIVKVTAGGQTKNYIGFPVDKVYTAVYVPQGYHAIFYSKDGSKRACTYASLGNLGEFFYPKLEIGLTHQEVSQTSIRDDLGYIIVRSQKNGQGECDDPGAFSIAGTGAQHPALIPRPIYYKQMLACLQVENGCPGVVTEWSNDTGQTGPGIGGGPSDSSGTPTCSIPKSSKPIVFVQKLSGGGEKCVLILDSVADLATAGLTAVDEVYFNDTAKYSEIQLFPQIGYSGGNPYVVTSTSTNLAVNPSGYSNKFKSVRLESREFRCGDGTKTGIYTKFSDGSCMYVTASTKLSDTPYKGLNIVKVWAVGEFWGKFHEKEDKTGANLEFSTSTKTTDGKRYYAYLEVKSYNKCDRGQLEALGLAYGNLQPDWNGGCVVLGKPGDKVSIRESSLRVLRSPGYVIYCWKDTDFGKSNPAPHAEYGNTPGKEYKILDNRQSCEVFKKNHAPNPPVPQAMHGQQFTVGSPIELCFASGGDIDNDDLTFMLQVYKPYNPTVYFGSLLLEQVWLNDAGCYRVTVNLPAGGYGYNIHAYDNAAFEPKQSLGMWGAFRVVDPSVPVVTDTTPNDTVVTKMPLICSALYFNGYDYGRVNFWRQDPGNWTMIGFNLIQPDSCWSPDQFGYTGPGNYMWEFVGVNAAKQSFPSGQYHTFVVSGADQVQPANGSTHNGYIPQVCAPMMGTVVSAVLPTTKDAYSVQLWVNGVSYGDYSWTQGPCWQPPNLGNGTYTFQVDLNTWQNVYQAGIWKRTFTVTGMPDPIKPANGSVHTAMPEFCQPKQGIWVTKYAFNIWQNNVYAGVTPWSTENCYTLTAKFPNGNYKVQGVVLAWNGQAIHQPSTLRSFSIQAVNSASEDEEAFSLDLTLQAEEISSEAQIELQSQVLETVQGSPYPNVVYLPLVPQTGTSSEEEEETDLPFTSDEMAMPVQGLQAAMVNQETAQAATPEIQEPAEIAKPEAMTLEATDEQPIEQSEMSAQIFLPIVAR